MTRVLHVGKFYPPHHGGMERVLQTVCQASRGIVESHVLVAHTSTKTVEEVVGGVPVTRVGTIGSAGSVHAAPSFARHLRRLASDSDFIVLHEPNPWALLSYALARPRAPLAIWYHSDVVRPALQYAFFYAPVARAAYRRAKCFIVSSPPLGACAKPLAAYQSRVRVIPFGIDPAPWHRESAPGSYVLFAGRHVDYKGVDVLLRALAGSTVRAMIAGDGPRRAEWERLAAALGLNGRVTFTGEVADAELTRMMHGASALVLPSISRAEAFGYVQLEAMAAGKPVISTDVPSGVSWVNQHGTTGLVVPAGDPDALRTAVEAISRDPVLQARFGMAGRARVEAEFTIDRLRERLRRFYEEMALIPAPPRHAETGV